MKYTMHPSFYVVTDVDLEEEDKIHVGCVFPSTHHGLCFVSRHIITCLVWLSLATFHAAAQTLNTVWGAITDN